MAKSRIRSGGRLSFGNVVAAFADSTIERMDQIHRGVVAMVAYKVIYRTPFGDPSYWKFAPPKDYVPGTARGNWQTESDALPPLTPIPLRSAEDAYAEAMANAGEAGSVTYIVNSVPYIMRLEYEGWSPQAPAGMVRLTVAEFQQLVNEYVRSLP